MPSVFFSWRPKLTRFGRKPTIEQSVSLVTDQIDVLPHDEPTALAPSSSNANPYINESDYGINQSIGFNEIDMFNNETPKMARSVRFTEGVGSGSSTSSKPVIVTNRPPSVIVQGSGSNVAPQNPLQTPVQHVGPPNRSSWNQTIINPMTPANDSIFNRMPPSMAPLATREEIEENSCPPPPPRPAKNFHLPDSSLTPPVYRSAMSHQYHPKENRANVLLQQLRADDGAQSESDVSANEVTLSIQPPTRSQSKYLLKQ
jgi:hypothetical protein